MFKACGPEHENLVARNVMSSPRSKCAAASREGPASHSCHSGDLCTLRLISAIGDSHRFMCRVVQELRLLPGIVQSVLVEKY